MFWYKWQILIINNLSNTKKYKRKLENHLKIIEIQNSMTVLVRRLDTAGKQTYELEDRPEEILQNIVQKDKKMGKVKARPKTWKVVWEVWCNWCFVGNNRRKGNIKELTFQFFNIAERNQSSDPGNQNESKAEKKNPQLEILKWTHRTSKKKRIS